MSDNLPGYDAWKTRVPEDNPLLQAQEDPDEEADEGLDDDWEDVEEWDEDEWDDEDY